MALSPELLEVLEVVSKVGPGVTAVAAVLALCVGSLTLFQKSRADRRDQWWKRAQWAMDHTLSESEENRQLGFRVLSVLGESKLARAEELAILESLADDELVPLAPGPDNGDDEGTDDPTEPEGIDE